MREWNNPELFSLGVENTFGNEHYCHADKNSSCTTNGGLHTNSPTASDKKEHIWTGDVCPDPTHVKGNGNGNGNEESGCCCYGIS